MWTSTKCCCFMGIPKTPLKWFPWKPLRLFQGVFLEHNPLDYHSCVQISHPPLLGIPQQKWFLQVKSFGDWYGTSAQLWSSKVQVAQWLWKSLYFRGILGRAGEIFSGFHIPMICQGFWTIQSGGCLGVGFKYFLCSYLGEDEPILTIIFFRWVETTN